MKRKVKIYMENGTVLEFVADWIEAIYSTGTGKLVKMKWGGIEPEVEYIDANRVIAVVTS